MKRAIIAFSLTCLAAPMASAEPGLAFLPSNEIINSAIEHDPRVAAATARMNKARSDAALLRRGEYETSLESSVDQRKYRNAGDVTEYSIGFSRGVRLPGKASADRSMAGVTLSIAENQLEDARHQVSLDFASALIAVYQTRSLVQLAYDDVETYKKDLAALQRRLTLKDVAALDVARGEAALAAAQAQLSAAQRARALAENSLSTRYALLENVSGTLSDPELPVRPLDQWAATILDRSHELQIMRDQAQLARLKARRADLDRVADPTIGLRLFNEAGGRETGVGIVASIPLGVVRRNDVYRSYLSAADGAEAELRNAEIEWRQRADQDVISTLSQIDTWRRSKDAAQSLGGAVLMLEKAYKYGEISQQDLLSARRQAQESARMEVNARADGVSALMRLYLDAHELWLNEGAHQ